MPLIFSPLPHEAARDRIAGLPLVTREVMDGLLPELKAYAFCITGIDSFDQLARTRDDIAAVPAGEATWAQAKKRIAADLSDRLGGKEATARAELLLRTHTFRGYAVARYRTLMAQTDIFPYWQYKTHGDGRVRPSHAALNGKILPAGHPVWQRIFPPWDWGCRCLVVPMLKKDVDKIRAAEDPTDPTDPTARKGPTLPPEQRRVWDGDIADAIHKAERLPGGISTQVPPSWGASPWSEPGTVRHTWGLIQERYGNDPELLRAFMDWAAKTKIDKGLTVSDWLDGKPAKPRAKAPRRGLKNITREFEKLATRYADWTARNVANKRDVAEGRKVPKAQLEQAEEKLRKLRADAWRRLALPADERGTIELTVTSLPPGMLPNDLADGVSFVESQVHRDLLPKVEIMEHPIPGQQVADFLAPRQVRLLGNSKASAVAHEITHAVEHQDAKVLRKATDFLKKRAGKATPKRLRDLTGIPDYRDEDVAYEDEWAKRGGDVYSGRLYEFQGHIHATEILTMGIERLYKDPLTFFSQDREYFEMVVSTLQNL